MNVKLKMNINTKNFTAMKKKLFFAAFALALFAGCSDNDYVGDQASLNAVTGNGAISFGFDVPTPTRASGATAATKLNNQFIVWGEKGETDATAPAAGNLVFPNYKVSYTANTAYTTTSNTKNWEYVGLKWSATDAANVKIATAAVTQNDQTIKYWDYAASNYVFTAVSAKPEDITNGRVVINKLTSDDDSKYEKGYTVTLSKTTSPDVYPSLADLYFSDRNEITQGTGKDRTATNAYGGNVTFTFRNALSQVRAGVYETIPGYAVTAIKFYVTGDAEAKVSETSAFGVIAKNTNPATYEGTLTVTYYDDTDDDTKNHPKLSFSGTPANDLILGTNMSTLSTSTTLGTTSASPTWDTNGGTFTSVLPQIDNTTNMKLKVDYTLYNSVTGETINITGKTAEVPGKYLAWKPNFKYTYLFKITDDELYPITFDAVTIEAEDGTAEYITTVTEPSITTFGVNSSTGKFVSGGSEYAASTDVYSTVMDASALATLSASNFSIYDVTTSDATNFPVTEASVAEALIEGPTWTKAQADNKKITCAAGPTLTFQNTVPAEDGTTITLDASNNKAAKFTTATGKKYALVYQKTAATYTTDSGKNDYTSDTFTAAGILYTDAACTTVATSWTSGTTYYKRTAVSNKGVYAVKIVTVP